MQRGDICSRRRRARWALAALAFAFGFSHAPSANERYPVSPWALGERLFNDPRLSADGRTACATCHRPDRAFSDDRPLARGVDGRTGTRNTPSLGDVGRRIAFGWDGRETDLASQALKPFTDPREMGLRDRDDLLARLARDAGYRAAFASNYGVERPTIEAVGASLRAFLVTLGAGPSAFDRFLGGDEQALTPKQRRGFELFIGAGACAQCHFTTGSPVSLTDDAYHRVGVGDAALSTKLPELVQRALNAERPSIELDALGRFLVTRNPKDIGAYRTPSLRNVAITAPYFHDGSVRTLEDAVAHELHYHGAPGRAYRGLTPGERADLVEFLRALTDDRYAVPK